MNFQRAASHQASVLSGALGTAIFVLLSSCAVHEDKSPLHPSFKVDFDDLSILTEQLPEEIRARILNEPVVFLDLMAKTLNQPSDLLVLVDKEHPLPDDYLAPDLVRLDGRGLTLTRASMKLRAIVLPDLTAMVEAARLAGTDVTISSAYRSFDRQAFLFEFNVERYGLEHTSSLVARPGYSQHQIGTSIDFGSIDLGYGETEEGRWVLANAWRFGFSLSYPKELGELTGYQYEPWHFRYLGRDSTEIERRFFGSVQQLFLVHYRHLMPALRASTGTSEPDEE